MTCLGWSNHPYGPWGGRTTPKEQNEPPPQRQKKKKKLAFGPWGWPNHPQGPLGTTPRPAMVVARVAPPFFCQFKKINK
jgi:hypothetical protein